MNELSKYVIDRVSETEEFAELLACLLNEGQTELVCTRLFGVPLCRLPGRPLEMTWVLGVAVGFASALGGLRKRGLIPDEFEPTKLLLNSSTAVAERPFASPPVEPAPLATGIPAPVSDIVLKLLAKKGEERSETAANLKADLRRWLKGSYLGKDRHYYSSRRAPSEVAPVRAFHSRAGLDLTVTERAERLDGMAVAKALQAISGEIVLEKLIGKFLKISVEQSGTDRGVLVLSRDGTLVAEAEARKNRDKVEVLHRGATESPFDLPESLIRSVARMRERVVIDDAAAESLFLKEDYVRGKSPRSVLCLPLLNQNMLIGLLYLEHSLTPDVFTANRLAMLELIASQGAISINNAQMFAGLARENSDRGKREKELQTGWDREVFANLRSAELAKANEALRGCLDALADVPQLDEFLGQITAAIASQLGAVSSTLRLWDFENSLWTLEFVYQDGRVMSPDEAEYPEGWRSLSLDETDFTLSGSKQPLSVLRINDPKENIADDHRAYLLGLGVKTVLVIPLISAGQALGRLTFRFNEDRDARPEEFEIARALATQASLAIHLTRLAKAAKQTAVMEERYRLAGEIHDSLAQNFSGISMQLFAAEEVIKNNRDDGLRYVERANDLARFGLAEARRSTLSLQSSVIEESGLLEALQMLVERSNIPDKIRCTFYSNGLGEASLAQEVQQDLLRIAQEGISNAMRHAKPTAVRVSLRSDEMSIVLEIKDNGCGIAGEKLETGDGFGFGNMKARAKKLNADIDIRTAPGRGTTIVVRMPLR